MVSVHELAAGETVSPRPQLVIVQAEKVATVRCPSCKGLRSVAPRWATRKNGVCQDCAKGHVVPKTQFHNYWLARYSMAEINEMARAIWG